MFELKFCGRGGQGVVVASQILGKSFFQAGLYPQCYSMYGGERRGAPVVSFLRVDEKKVLLKCEVTQADELVYFDPSLVQVQEVESLLKPGGRILVGGKPDSLPATDFAQYKLGFVDARDVAGRVGLGRMVNTAILGAYCRFSGRLALDDLIATIRESVPAYLEPNIEAARLGYAEVTMPN